MSPINIEIPPEYASKLETISASEVDTRTDDEIIASLTTHVPVTSEKNIWAFWLTGIDSMPAWCKRNVASWVRMHKGLGWTVRVLDNVAGSPNNAVRYVGEDLLTPAFVKQEKMGQWPGQHSADLVRGAVLVQHGGVWIDCGCILFRVLDRGLWGELVARDGAGMGGAWADETCVNNCLIAARKGDEFMKNWHALYRGLYDSDLTKAHGILAAPMWPGLLGSMKRAPPRLKWEFKVDHMTILQYSAHMMCQMRLAHLQEPNGFDGVNYWLNRYVLTDLLPECYGKEEKLGFNSGPRFLELMKIRRDDVENKNFEEAKSLAWHMLANTCMQKVSRGPGLTAVPELGHFLDQEENKDVDVKEGTFFELLRYGAEHFRQTRESIVLVEPQQPHKIIHEGVFGPIQQQTA